MKFNNEVLIVRVTVLNRGPCIELPKKFQKLVRVDHVSTGRTQIRFPIQNLSYERLVTQFQKQYPQLEFDIGAKTIETY